MKTPIGSIFMYNIIILFIVIVFAFLSGIMSYYKAFKVNNRIIYIIEKYEGYNSLAIQEIQKQLDGLGYSQDMRNLNCAGYKEANTLVNINENSRRHRYCVYVDANVANSSNHGNDTYYVYTIKTYMSLDLPLVSWIRIPITTKTNQIYKFTNTAPITNFK